MYGSIQELTNGLSTANFRLPSLAQQHWAQAQVVGKFFAGTHEYDRHPSPTLLHIIVENLLDDHRLSRGLAFNGFRVDHVYPVSFFGHSISQYRSTTCAMTYIVSRVISVRMSLLHTSHAFPSSSCHFPLSLPCLAFSKWSNATPFTPLSCMLHAILVHYAACICATQLILQSCISFSTCFSNRTAPHSTFTQRTPCLAFLFLLLPVSSHFSA